MAYIDVLVGGRTPIGKAGGVHAVGRNTTPRYGVKGGCPCYGNDRNTLVGDMVSVIVLSVWSRFANRGGVGSGGRRSGRKVLLMSAVSRVRSRSVAALRPCKDDGYGRSIP